MNLIEIEHWQRDADLEDLEGFRHGTRAAPTFYRMGIVKATEGDGPMVFVASDDGADRHGDTIAVDGWDIEGFKANPVFLWLHGMDTNHLLPIGRVPKVWAENKQLLAAVEWDVADGFAVEVRDKYQRGFLKAVSVGFRPLEFDEIEPDGDKGAKGSGRGIKFLKQELLEVSAVPVPANPRALQRAKGWNLTKRYWPNMPKPVAATVINQANLPASSHGVTIYVVEETYGNNVTTSTIATSTIAPPQPGSLAPIAKAIREFNEALRGPGGE